MTRLLIGLDPGVNTGMAAWDFSTGRLSMVETLSIHVALTEVRGLMASGILAGVKFEDARLRTWYGAADARAARAGAGIREGVGSVKRDCAIWQDFLADEGIPFVPVKPTAGSTKWAAGAFKAATGWTSRTSEHGRDAALLVFGTKEAAWKLQLATR